MKKDQCIPGLKVVVTQQREIPSTRKSPFGNSVIYSSPVKGSGSNYYVMIACDSGLKKININRLQPKDET